MTWKRLENVGQLRAGTLIGIGNRNGTDIRVYERVRHIMNGVIVTDRIGTSLAINSFTGTYDVLYAPNVGSFFVSIIHCPKEAL